MGNPIAILGAGGCAREVYWYIHDTCPETEVIFVDDLTEVTAIRMGEETVPVVKDWRFEGIRSGRTGQLCNVTEFVVGVGLPHVKRILVKKALDSQLRPASTVIHPRAVILDPGCVIGMGGVIAPGAVITANVQLGDYVLINYNATIGHDTWIGDYASCNPGCNVSGNVKIGEGVCLGAGTVVREKSVIAPDVITGAQCCVVSDINTPGITVVGIPARELTS